jgi:putative ABC transport system permease protein
MRLNNWFDSTRQDVRDAVRSIRSNPGITAATLLVLGLMVGASTAVFALVDAVLIQPLPYPGSDRLVGVVELTPRQREFPVSAPNFLDWKAQGSAQFESMAALLPRAINVSGGAISPERLRAAAVTPEFFSVIGVQPAFGNVFASDSEKLVLIGHSHWQRRFGSRASVVGESLVLDGQMYVVGGVMPQGFDYPQDAEVWLPLAFGASIGNRGSHQYYVIGRLAVGETVDSAQSAMSGIARQLSQAYTKTNTDWTVKVIALHEQLTGPIRSSLIAVFVAVCVLPLLACANIGSLMFARSLGRRKDLAVRAALGAGRGRLIAQLLTESTLLAVVGGAVGLLFAFGGIKLLGLLLPPIAGVPDVDTLALDPRAFAFAVFVSLLSALLFGAAPAIVASRAALNHSLRASSKNMTQGRSARWALNAVTATQLALSIVLLVGAMLLAKSYGRLHGESLGFTTNNLLTLELSMAGERYTQPADRLTAFERLMDDVATVPGVQSAAMVSVLPLLERQQGFNGFRIEGQVYAPDAQDFPVAYERPITEKYFETMEVPLVFGRTFTDFDHVPGSLPVAIIDVTTAAKYWPNESPLGKRINFGWGDAKTPWLEIVGVVGAVKIRRLNADLEAMVYRPLWQATARDMAVVVRTSAPSSSVTEGVTAAIRRIDPELPVANTRSMSALVSTAEWRPRFTAMLMGMFAISALALAVVGIYGVMSQNVSRRISELALRRTLGATAGAVFAMIVKETLVLVAIGTVVGAATSLWVGQTLETLLYGVESSDWQVYVTACVVLAVTTVAAVVRPALRAATVPPMLTLRSE